MAKLHEPERPQAGKKGSRSPGCHRPPLSSAGPSPGMLPHAGIPDLRSFSCELFKKTPIPRAFPSAMGSFPIWLSQMCWN